MDLKNNYTNLSTGIINQNYSEAIIWTEDIEKRVRIMPTDEEKLLFELSNYNPVEIKSFN